MPGANVAEIAAIRGSRWRIPDLWDVAPGAAGVGRVRPRRARVRLPGADRAQCRRVRDGILHSMPPAGFEPATLGL